MDRRRFLRSSLTSGLAVGFAGLTGRLARFNALGTAPSNNLPYGPLAPAVASNTGETLLELPAGFRYTVIGRTDSPMTNGQPTPKLHDGMAAFGRPGDAVWAVARNHEVSDLAGTHGTVSGTPPYDELAGGGMTTIVVDRRTRLITNAYTSLSGTVRNCAGGRTPWQTWISCEETVAGTSNGYGRPHGYCFDVDPLSPGPAVALTAMGRFRHEAVGVEPVSGIVYLTEDLDPCGFYRFIPNRYGQLGRGGRLQMLAVSGREGADLRTGQTVGTSMLVEWVDIADPDPPSAETDPSAVFAQGHALGGAIFRRLEGCFSSRLSTYFTATTGGDAGLGQVWRYDQRPKSRFGHLTLVFESPNADVLDLPDNICFAPCNRLLICEDGSNGNSIRLLSPDGSLGDFARNIVPGFETYELTGCTFSPDFQTLFVNVQTPGLTFAIWGDW